MWLGVDLGTQSVRVMAVSESGQVLAQHSHPLVSGRDGPRHEQDAEPWWSAFATACRATVRDLAVSNLVASDLRGIAVDGTSGTILLMDESGHALTPALMYDDVRAEDEACAVNEAFDRQGVSDGHMQPSWALPKLLWLLRNGRPMSANARLAHQVDFINFRLAGHAVAADSSNALKTGYDLLRNTWPHAVLDALGVPDHILPAVVRPGSKLGAVCDHAATTTGLAAGTPIVAGMTDGCAAQIAAGALDVGGWNSVLGTTLVLKGVTRHRIGDPAGIVYSHRSPDGDWLPGAASSTGAGILPRRLPGRDLDSLALRAARREPTPVIAYPLLGRGERFPFCATNAEGFMEGSPADEVELYSALLQGVAFVERLCFDYLSLLGAPLDGNLTLTGGATASHHWCQLRADVLNRAVHLPENVEPALGMAMLAAASLSGRRVAEVARQMVRVRAVIDPRRSRTARLCELYLRFLEELERRGWLPPALAEHAKSRVPASE